MKIKEQREIKFRAWNIESKNMTYGPSGAGIDLRMIGRQGEFVMLNPIEDYSWLQYTGLKDKNFKPLYEGDIFEYKAHPMYNLHSFIAAVFWNNRQGCWAYKGINIESNFAEHDELQSDIQEHIEIIGNIYENPNLI